MNLNFKGKTVLITGGTRGIGKSIAEHFASSGAEVYYTGKAPTHKAANKALKYISLDLGSDKSVAAFLEKFSKVKIHVLVNNAGVNKIAPFAKISAEDFNHILKVNLVGPFALCQHFSSRMAKEGFGRIINVASIFSQVSKEQRASYSSSKFGLVGLTKSLAIEMASQNVLVNAVSPGFIDTELTREVLGEAQIKTMIAQVPMKRLGTPDEIAKLVLFLGSEANTFITGQNILIDGGFTCV